MTLKVSGFSSAIATYKIVKDAVSNATAETDVTGTSGRIYHIDVSNTAGTHVSYAKFKLTSGTVTPGTTEPDMMLAAPPSTAKAYSFPNGLAFEQLSFWTTRAAATSDTTTPNTTIITILCS